MIPASYAFCLSRDPRDLHDPYGLVSQEDDIRGFVRQEMSQHCGEWGPAQSL